MSLHTCDHTAESKRLCLAPECSWGQAMQDKIDALQSEVAELRRKLRQEYGGMLDEQEALRTEVERLKAYTESTELADKRKLGDLILIERAENARLREALEKIISFGGCLCGHFEWCESCSSTSEFNRARKTAREAIQQSPVPSVSAEKP